MALTFRGGSVPALDLKSVHRNEEIQCRICFETEECVKKLIHPCKCSGSMKFVHEECLKLWILSSNQELKNPFCDICKTGFKMEVQLARKCSCKNFSDECFNVIIFPLVFVIIATILAVVLVYLIKGAQEGTLKLEEKIYFSLVMLACSAIMLTLSYVFVKTINKACCVLKIKKWKIKNLNLRKLDQTFDGKNETEAVHTEVNNFGNGTEEMREEVCVPRVVMFRGMSVVTPEISGATMSRARRPGSAFFSRQRSQRSGNGTSRRENESVNGQMLVSNIVE